MQIGAIKSNRSFLLNLNFDGGFFTRSFDGGGLILSNLFLIV